MNFNTLFHYVTVVECGSITKAAKKLYMAQPPLSNQMASLEAEFNTKFFIRGARSITLTKEGEEMYQKALMMLKLLDSTHESISNISSKKYQTLTIGSTSAMSFSFLPHIIKGFNDKYEGLDIKIIEDTTNHLLDDLIHGIIKIALLYNPVNIPSSFKCIPLKKRELILVSNTDIPDISKLDNVMIVSRWVELVKNEFNNKGLDIHFNLKADSSLTILALIKEGMGIGIVPSDLINVVESMNLKYKAFLNDTLSYDISLVYSDNLNVIENEFINEIKKL